MLNEFEAAQPEYDDGREHPRPEQIMMRKALESLTSQDRLIWEYYAYDQLSYREIGEKLQVTKQAVALRIKRIERDIKKWCDLHKGAYLLLKIDQYIDGKNNA